MSSLLISLVTSLVFVAQVNAEAPVVKTTTTTTTVETTTIESDGVEEEAASTETTAKDDEITTVFGSTATTGLAGCKTEELSKTTVRDLKSDCSAWMKDQKAQLKDKYLTGTCEEQCSDCSMGLRRCSVKGSVRYSKANVKK